MRQLFIAVVAATAALALASCDPRELVVTDNSALKSITLQVNNDRGAPLFITAIRRYTFS